MAGLKHLFDIIALNIEHQMEIERACGKIVEPGADELRSIGLNRCTQNIRHAPGKGRGCLVHKGEHESDPPIQGQRVVGNFLFQQFAV